jgi:hypothetical protein
MLREKRRILQVASFQQTFFDQHLQAQEQRIASEYRDTLVRGAAVACRAQGQHLPQTLFSVGQEIGEAISLSPQVSDTESARERGGMEEDAACSGRIHFIISLRCG